MNITQKNGTHNTTYSKGRQIKWIVIHYTAGVSSHVGTALNTANWFLNPASTGSADYIVDDATIVQYNSDISNRYCWAVGGKKYTTMTTKQGGVYYGQCTNANSISIELCSNKTNPRVLGATDIDWYFTESTVNNAAELTAQLMRTYGIDINHVIMHHQVTGKVCPNPFCVNTEALKLWDGFRDRVVMKMAPVKTKTISLQVPYKVEIIGKDISIHKHSNKDSKKVGTKKLGATATIIQEKNGFGLLKKYADNKDGWINLKYTKRI